MELEQILRQNGWNAPLLAKGGMGEVYLGKHAKTKEPVAAKLELVQPKKVASHTGRHSVHVDYAGEGKILISSPQGLQVCVLEDKGLTLQHLMGERDSLHRLSLQHVEEAVGYKGQQFFLVGGHLCSAMYMDYLAKGMPLNVLLMKPMNLERKYAILHSVGKAIQKMEAHKVVHKDIKPANVMVFPDNSVRLVDFGLSRVQEYQPLPGDPPDVAVLLNEKIRVPGSLTGTLGYCPTDEALYGKATTAVDTFSYGMIAHEVLTGLTPYFLRVQPWQEQLEHLIAYDEANQEEIVAEVRAASMPEMVALAVGECIHPEPRQRTYRFLMKVCGKLSQDSDAYEVQGKEMEYAPTLPYVRAP